MSIGLADILTAVKGLWASRGLDAQFTAHWTAAQVAGQVVLEDEQAAPDHAWPYCVLTVDQPRVLARMSGDAAAKRELREVGVKFTVHADKTALLSAKELAASLAEEVMKAFGGHPTVVPGQLELASGGAPLCQYVGDWVVREPNYRYAWTVSYRIVVDVPSAVETGAEA